MKEYKDKLKEYRKRYGLTQSELAKKLRISPCTITNIERGQKPSLLTQGKIEKIIKSNDE